MKKIIFLLLIQTFVFQSCSVPKRMTSNKSVITSENLKGIVFEGGDGSSFEDAVIILKARNTSRGIAAENEYINQVYGERGIKWNKISQALLSKNNKDYDVITIQTIPENKKLEIYFDITDFFGKW